MDNCINVCVCVFCVGEATKTKGTSDTQHHTLGLTSAQLDQIGLIINYCAFCYYHVNVASFLNIYIPFWTASFLLC